MALLTVNEVNRTGVAKTAVAAAGGGDTFTPGKTTFLYVLNGGGGSITVTAATSSSVIDGVTVGNPAATVAAGVEKMLGPYPPEHFADATDGLVHITYSGVTSVTVMAMKLTQP